MNAQSAWSDPSRIHKGEGLHPHLTDDIPGDVIGLYPKGLGQTLKSIRAC